jgi:hypothetical protein
LRLPLQYAAALFLSDSSDEFDSDASSARDSGSEDDDNSDEPGPEPAPAAHEDLLNDSRYAKGERLHSKKMLSQALKTYAAIQAWADIANPAARMASLSGCTPSTDAL